MVDYGTKMSTLRRRESDKEDEADATRSQWDSDRVEEERVEREMRRSAQSEMGVQWDGRWSGSGVSRTEDSVASKVQLKGFCCFFAIFFSVCMGKSLYFPPN